MGRLPLPARLYIGFTIALGTLVLAYFGPRTSFTQPWLFAVLLATSAATSAFKVSLPIAKSGSTMSVSYAVDFATLLLLGPNATMLVSVVSVWTQCTYRMKVRNPLYRTLFSMAALAITVQAAGFAFTTMGGVPGTFGDNVTDIGKPLFAAATTYFLFNTCQVGIAVALTTRQSFFSLWQQNYLWSAPSYFVGAAAAAIAAWAMIQGGIWIGLLTAAPLYLTYRSYKIYLGRISEGQRQGQELADLHLATIEALARAIDAKDQTGQSHIRRVQAYAAGLAQGFGMSDNEIQGVRTAALLHDIGKLAVPEHILSKPGPLTQEEFQKVRIHPQVGAEIISAVPFPYPVAPLILSHHERWDGKGYPHGLKGTDIPLGARILSVVDYYDALTSERPYHKAMTHEGALALLQQEAGRALDPAIVQMFLAMIPQMAEAAEAAAPVTLVQPEHANGNIGRPSSELEPDAAKNSVFEDIALAHREIYALYELAQTMGTSLGVADTMALIASKLSNLVPFSACALFLYLEKSDELMCKFATGVDDEKLGTLSVRGGHGLSGWVARNRRPLVNAKPGLEFEAAGYESTTTLQSALIAPLVFGDRLIGTLGVYHVDVDFYTDNHRRLVDHVCEQVAAVINNSMVFEKTQEDSLTDPLTMLPNTRFMFTYLTRELARAERLKAEVALLVMDLDGFKEINDTHGHHVGDRALRQVAEVLKSAIRPYDICIRYAGDEFIVVLSGCGQEEAERKRLEMQRAVDDVTFEARPGRRVPLAVSVGAAIFPRDGRTYEELLSTADSRMYRDKTRRKQRGRVRRTAMAKSTGSVPLPFPEEISEIEIQRAGFGVL
jgi:diguanylate cyclase (GGDEF)-like protein/putative nucleotidyltransferase with HDIG domain